MAVHAFTAWGTGLVALPAAVGAFNDAAILLFIIDGACLVVTEARTTLAWPGKRPVQPRLQHPPAEPQASSLRDHAAARMTAQRDLDAGPLPPRLPRQSDLILRVPAQRA